MALSKLYYVYGLDTSCFYTDLEKEYENKIVKARHIKNLIRKRFEKNKKGLPNTYGNSEKIKYDNKTLREIQFLSEYAAKYKDRLKNEIKKNSNLVRTVRPDKIYTKKGDISLRRVVSTFDGNLTRCFNMKEREFNPEIVIVKVYYFGIAESIVNNGFYIGDKKYIFFSSSAGQIRTKKLVAVDEELLNQNWNKLTAGLTVEQINKNGGMNINKYLAYLALCNSATDLWEDFDIDRSIVVNDFENTISGMVDFIDETNYEITRTVKELPFTQTDGCGMILPSLSDRNFMVRLPWVKGLLAVFDFRRFIKERKASGKVTDIYGQEHDIFAEDIQIIFTKSQLKMASHFRDWEQYKANFKRYGCTAGKCNVEEDIFPDSVINYQMIQTLSDLSDNELMALGYNNQKEIENVATDMKTMLKVFGAVSWNRHKNGFQKCLEIYPELLADSYSKKTLRDLKTKLEKNLWSARFEINGKYTFVIPDLYAFCENIFLNESSPTGILKDGEVCCRLFKHQEKLDCLRSPHLYIEHPIRINNTDNDWFTTNAIYVSCHDLISRIDQMDYDGDKLLVTNNQTLVKAAERNNKNKDVVPLFYNMKKANAEQLTPQSLFKGLLLAYNGGNIGLPSNNITKIWNSGHIHDEQLKVIKWLCAEVNYTIDYAKTLFKPERPQYVNDIITKYTNAKVPAFFRYAKGKDECNTERTTECSVDRIKKLFPRKNLKFRFSFNNIGKFDYHTLMHNPKAIINPELAERFRKITSSLNFNNVSDEDMFNYLAIYDNAKKDIVSGNDIHEVVDSVIIDLFSNKKTPFKKAFWTLFGEIVYDNIKNNLDSRFALCKVCGSRFYQLKSNQVNCHKCVGHPKMMIKTIICRDCGKLFEVSSTSRNRIRCEQCQKIFRSHKDKRLRELKRQTL